MRPGHDDDHPTPSSSEVKEEVELYLYSPSGPSWPVLGWTLPLLVKNCAPFNHYTTNHTLRRITHTFYRSSWQGRTSQYDQDTHILGARSPRRLNFVPWCLIFVDPQYGTCFMSPSWRLKFWCGSQIFIKCVHSRSKMMAVCNNYDTVRYRQLRNTRAACCLIIRDKVVSTGHVVSE